MGIPHSIPKRSDVANLTGTATFVPDTQKLDASKRFPTEEEKAAQNKQAELDRITVDLADALEGLLGQAAVDGADDDEINPQSVFAANAALRAFKQNPHFNPQDYSLPPEASKLNNGKLVQLLGACVRDLIPLAQGEIQTRTHTGLITRQTTEQLQRAQQALSYLNDTKLSVEYIPTEQFDDDFEIHFDWQFENLENPED
jgi:hypothetical protein